MQTYDIIIIGAGPGGYETAGAAAAMGLNTLLVERDKLGGTCLNRGCIPTKTLCRTATLIDDIRNAAELAVTVPEGEVRADWSAAIRRKEQVVDQLRSMVQASLARVTVVEGEARFTATDTIAVGDETYTAPRIVIATGSEPARLPIPGAELAVTSDDLLSMDTVPQNVVIIGGGVIGMEFAGILHAFGCEVTVIEYCKEILPPFDKDIAKRLRTAMSRRGIDVIVNAAVTGITAQGVTYESKGKTLEAAADMVVMAVGRRPVIPAGLDLTGVEYTPRGIKADPRTMATNVESIYAIGDVNGQCMLAHAATAQGMAMLGKDINLDVVPAAVFTNPECAMVGLTEEQCKARELNIKVAKVPFRGNGKALAMGESDGLVKLIADADTHRILGCHICGPHAADLIQEPATVMANGLTLDAILRAIHGHPTLGETITAAAHACL